MYYWSGFDGQLSLTWWTGPYPRRALRSRATCTRRVRRAGGRPCVPHGSSWERQKKDLVSQTINDYATLNFYLLYLSGKSVQENRNYTPFFKNIKTPACVIKTTHWGRYLIEMFSDCRHGSLTHMRLIQSNEAMETVLNVPCLGKPIALSQSFRKLAYLWDFQRGFFPDQCYYVSETGRAYGHRHVI